MGARMTIIFGEEPGMEFEAAQHSTGTFPETLAVAGPARQAITATEQLKNFVWYRMHGRGERGRPRSLSPQPLAILGGQDPVQRHWASRLVQVPYSCIAHRCVPPWI